MDETYSGAFNHYRTVRRVEGYFARPESPLLLALAPRVSRSRRNRSTQIAPGAAGHSWLLWRAPVARTPCLS